MRIYKNLYKHFGPQGWWPPTNTLVGGRPVDSFDHHFEICVGAILTQNTAWANVEKALQNLICAELLTPEAIIKCPTARLAKLIRSAGYFRQKAKKLKIFSKFLIENYRGNLKNLFKCQLSIVKCQLLSLWGVGPETADSMILYAGGKPSFVIDTYTKRLCECFGIKFKTYDEYKKFFETALPRNIKLFNEYHALIVAWGKLYRKNKTAAVRLLR